MSRVRSADTSPELRVRSLLHRHGFRFRLHRRDLPGAPDIVLPRYKVAIFVHGCFWHGHGNCRRATIPKTRPDFWVNKISRNRERDAIVEGQLIELGFEVVVLWQCQLKNDGDVVKRVCDAICRRQ